MLHQELLDPATRKLAEALLSQEQIQARKRWALLQLSLWHERGLVQPLVGAGQYCLTPTGRRQLRHALLEQQLLATPDGEQHIQQLALELPAQAHRQVLAALLHGSRRYRWRDGELAALAAEGTQATQDGLLRIRSSVPFTLFFAHGGLLDANATLTLLGELVIPESALQQLHKVLWTQTPPQQVITVESRAAFASIVPQPGQLLLLTPPEHPQLAARFLATLTPNYTWGHLGDLHPQALRQQQKLAELIERPLRLLLPHCLPELVSRYGQPLAGSTAWIPAELSAAMQLALAPLITQQRWLEHESMALFVRDQLSAT